MIYFYVLCAIQSLAACVQLMGQNKILAISIIVESSQCTQLSWCICILRAFVYRYYHYYYIVTGKRDFLSHNFPFQCRQRPEAALARGRRRLHLLPHGGRLQLDVRLRGHAVRAEGVAQGRVRHAALRGLRQEGLQGALNPIVHKDNDIKVF